MALSQACLTLLPQDLRAGGSSVAAHWGPTLANCAEVISCRRVREAMARRSAELRLQHVRRRGADVRAARLYWNLCARSPRCNSSGMAGFAVKVLEGRVPSHGSRRHKLLLQGN